MRPDPVEVIARALKEAIFDRYVLMAALDGSPQATSESVAGIIDAALKDAGLAVVRIRRRPDTKLSLED